MSQQSLQSIDFGIFRQLLSACLPDGSAFLVLDAQGERVYGEGEITDGVAERALEQLRQSRSENTDETIHKLSTEAESSLLGARLTLPGAAELVGALIVSMPGAPGSESSVNTKMLEAIVSSVCNDLALNNELDSMAGELTERYEELNLVYHTEDQVNYFAEGQNALAKLVANCCDYLNVGLAALVLRDKGVTLIEKNTSQSIDDVSNVIKRLKGEVYQHITDGSGPLVINDVAAQEAYRAWLGMPYKALVCPILDKSGEVDGVLAIINEYSRPNFSNGDRNLLSVMARKAAKIIQVNYDALTGLMNREGFAYFVEKALQETRFQETEHAVVHLNVDKLHVINDTISHAAGDAVIRSISRHLRDSVRDSDIVARLGGNDIGVLLQNCATSESENVANKLREDISELLIPWEGDTLTVTASLGSAPVEPSAESAGAVLAAAELACQAAKEAGKNRVQAYDYGNTQLIRRQQEMESIGHIQSALRDDRFILFGQLIKPLQETGRWHLEVLLRMQDDEGKPLGPDRFLTAAERYHLMPAIDRWVVTNTLKLCASHWDNVRGALKSVSINLSGQSLGDPDFMGFLEQVLDETEVPPENLCFEITETAAIANLARAEQIISAVKTRGCRFSLDDFGSGLSSFGYLRALPVDYLKIDGSIVKEIARDGVSSSMVGAIHQIATVMGLKTIAEFVEDEAIETALHEIGIDYAQGYGVARPIALVDQFNELEGSEAVGQ